MKKKTWLTVALAAVLCFALAACGPKETVIEEAGQTTVIENVKGAPDEYAPKQVAYAVAGKLAEYDTYRVSTNGTAVAKKGFINYSQTISNEFTKNGDEYFLNAKSDSSLVKMKHQAFGKDGKVVFRNDDRGALTVAETADYGKVYGVVPGAKDLLGWIANDESIAFAEKLSASNGESTYRYILDPVKGTTAMRAQTKEFGSLSDYPVFSEVELQLTVKDDWTPVRLVSKTAYSISKAVIGEMDCTQTLTSEFSSVNGAVTVADTAAFNAAIGSTPTKVNPSDTQKDPILEGLVSSLVEYDLQKGVTLRGQVSADLFGKTVSVPVTAAAQIDLTRFQGENAAKAVKADFVTALAGIPVEVHFADGSIYLRVGETKMKTALPASTIAGLTDLQDYFTIAKETYGYSLSLGDLIKGQANTALAASGLKLDTAKLRIDVSNERAASVTAEFALAKTGDASRLIGLELDLVLADKAYVSPDLSAYAPATTQFVGFTGNLDATVMGFIPVRLGLDFDLSIDPDRIAAGDLAESITVRGRIDISGASTILSMVPDLSDILPAGATYIDVAIYEGNCYLMIGKAKGDTETVLSLSEQSLTELLGSLDLGGLLGGVTAEKIDSVLDYALTNLIVEKNGDRLIVRANDKMLADFDALWADLIAEAAKSAGEMGPLLKMFFGNLAWEKIALTVTPEPFDLTFELYTEALPISLQITQKADAEIDRNAFDGFLDRIAAESADLAAAKSVNDRILAFAAGTSDSWGGFTWDAMDLTDATGAKIAEARSAYDALTPAQQKKVTAYENLAAYQKQYDKSRAACDTFAETFRTEFEALDVTDAAAWTSLNAKFDYKQTYERAYLATLLPEYIDARRTFETDAIAALESKIDTFLTAYDAASDTDGLMPFFADAEAIETDYAKLCAKSQAAIGNYASFTDKKAVYTARYVAYFVTACNETAAEMREALAAIEPWSAEKLAETKAKYDDLAVKYEEPDEAPYEMTDAYMVVSTLYENEFSVLALADAIAAAKTQIEAYVEKYDALMKKYSVTEEEFNAYRTEYDVIYAALKQLEMSGAKKAAGSELFDSKTAEYRAFLANRLEQRIGKSYELMNAMRTANTATAAEAAALQAQAAKDVALYDACEYYVRTAKNVSPIYKLFQTEKTAFDAYANGLKAAAQAA